MMDKAPRASLIPLAAALLGLLGCEGPLDARLLDRTCSRLLRQGPACEIVGVGSIKTALTDDTRGYRLEDAALVVHLDGLPSFPDGPFGIDVLAVAREPETTLDVELTWGSCTGCPASPPPATLTVPTDYAWVRVASDLRVPASGVTIPYDARLTLAGVETDLADLRLVLAP